MGTRALAPTCQRRHRRVGDRCVGRRAVGLSSRWTAGQARLSNILACSSSITLPASVRSCFFLITNLNLCKMLDKWFLYTNDEYYDYYTCYNERMYENSIPLPDANVSLRVHTLMCYQA